MRLIILTMLLLQIFNLAHARFNKNDGIYSSIELNVGNYYGIDFTID